MAMDCGGCEGVGRHRRWCAEVVGYGASLLGRFSQQAETLGDQIGSNNTRAANMAYSLASELRQDANARAAEYMDRYGTSH